MVFVAAGQFDMGSPPEEADRHHDEGQHRVTLSTPFLIARTPITASQYHEVMGATPPRPRIPIADISWRSAVDFCTALTAQEDTPRFAPDHPTIAAIGTYRLPTEAEWEYACRAGTSTRFCSGDTVQALSRVAWFAGNSGDRLHAIAQRRPNQWGLFDMHGGVWEWCQDWHGSYSRRPVVDPVGPPDGHMRILRGGSFFLPAPMARSAARGVGIPDLGHHDVGFRIACSVAVETST